MKLNNVNGKLIKERRIELRISQISLAKGICTQAMISLIERNNNITPGFNLIHQLCERLNLSMNDVLSNPSYNKDALKYIENQIFKNNYKNAYNKWLSICVSKLDSAELKGRYYCYGGILKLYVKPNNTSFASALHDFNFSFKHYRFKLENFYRIWCEIGMSEAYYYLDHIHEAKDYLDEAFQMFIKLTSIKNFDHELLSRMYTKIAQNYLLFDESQIAVNVCNHAINLSRQKKRTNNIHDHYLIAAECLIKLKQFKQAKKYLKLAKIFSQFHRDESKEKRIKNMLDNM